MKFKLRKSEIYPPVIALIIFLLAWQLISVTLKIPTYILPSPVNIMNELRGNSSITFNNYYITFYEAFIGMLIGSIFGFTTGCLIAESSNIRKISLPFLISSNAIPVVAIAPIILIWFGPGLISKVAVTAFISFFPLALNTFRGLSEYPTLYNELFSVYGATKMEFFYKYKIGNAMPYIFTGLKLNATLAPIGAIVGEFVSADKGIGFAIMQANYSFNSPRLWGYIILACSIGVIFYLTISIIEEYFFNKFKSK